MDKEAENAVRVTGHDNRGDENIQFGFVYFDDGTRVGYATDIPYRPPVWQTLGWEATPEHVRLATEYLTDLGVIKQPKL